MPRQEGHVLLELMVAGLIAMLLAVWGAGEFQRQSRQAGAQAAAQWMLALSQASGRYIASHGAQIRQAADSAALAHAGFADWSRPTVPELAAAGWLPSGFAQRGPFGIDIEIHVVREGDCSAACRVHGLVHSRQAIGRRVGAPVDEAVVAQWLMASQGLGGWVSPARTTQIRGATFSWPNPPVPGAAALPAGAVAMLAASGMAGQEDFLRVGDDRDPDFQGNFSLSGQAAIQGGLQAGQTIETAADLVAQGHLRIGEMTQMLLPCTVEGAIARETGAGLLYCRNGAWMPGRGQGGGFSYNTRWGCMSSMGISTANPVTGACSCLSGHAHVLISDTGQDVAPYGRTLGYLCVD